MQISVEFLLVDFVTFRSLGMVRLEKTCLCPLWIRGVGSGFSRDQKVCLNLLGLRDIATHKGMLVSILSDEMITIRYVKKRGVCTPKHFCLLVYCIFVVI